MKAKFFYDIQSNCRQVLTSVLMEYVREHGEDYADNASYWSNEFGIYEEDGCKVTKVLDLFGNEGCCVISQRNVNPDIDIDKCKTFDELLELTDDHFIHNAFQQLYIEVDKYGNEDLKYYSFWNTGIYFSDGMSEPDHDYVRTLSLSEIEAIMRVVEKTFE